MSSSRRLPSVIRFMSWPPCGEISCGSADSLDAFIKGCCFLISVFACVVVGFKR